MEELRRALARQFRIFAVSTTIIYAALTAAAYFLARNAQ